MREQLKNVAVGACAWGAFALVGWGLYWLAQHHGMWLVYGFGALVLLGMLAVTGEAMRGA